MRNMEYDEFYREDLVVRIKADIRLLNDVEISDIFFALLDEYRRMFPDWEIVLLSTEKENDPKVTYSKLVELLKSHKKYFVEEKNASLG